MLSVLLPSFRNFTGRSRRISSGALGVAAEIDTIPRTRSRSAFRNPTTHFRSFGGGSWCGRSRRRFRDEWLEDAPPPDSFDGSKRETTIIDISNALWSCTMRSY